MTGSSSPSAPFSTRAFRDALSAFATGITIITTRDEDGTPVGMTASSFNSVSLDPPLILWSVGRTNLSAPIFTRSDRFAVHVLAADQIALSNRFAKSGIDKFEGLAFDKDEYGLPSLPGALARFSCKRYNIYDGGDHAIIVGEVTAFETGSGEPLVFSKASYVGTKDLVPKAAPSNGSQDSSQDGSQNATLGGGGGIDSMLVYHLSRAYHQLSGKLHAAVEEAGLTLPQWRILASLYGERELSYSDLAARVFLNTNKLDRLLMELSEQGLCKVIGKSGGKSRDESRDESGDKSSGTGDTRTIRGTRAGHDRVSPLFALSTDTEEAALGATDPESRQNLTKMLERIVTNTNGSD
ncbi:MAG: flavin reductase [Pseudomonadota bacterium]